MTKETFLSIVLIASASQASVQELLPGLSASDLKVKIQAQRQLFDDCSTAGRPGAEDERKALALEICAELNRELSQLVASQLIRNLQRIGGAESVPTLVKLLGNSNEHIRDDARRALAGNSSAEAGQALQALLKMRKTRNAREMAGLINGLGERREAGASKLIAAHLSSKDPYIFAASAKALSRLNEADGIRALAERRKKEKGYRKVMLDSALFETDRSVVFEKLYAERETEEVRAVALLGLILNNELSVAAEAMSSGNPTLQAAVIEAARQGKSAKVYDMVASSIGSLPPYLQVQALGALEFSRNRDYATVVEPLLKSSDGPVAVSAAMALSRIGTPKSVPVLIESGTAEARRALGLLNADGVDKILEYEAAKKGEDTRRAVAIDALAIRGRRDLIPAFFGYAVEDGKETSKSAVKAIGLIGDLSNLEQLTQLMVEKESSPISRDILKSIVEIMRRSTDPAEAVNILVAQMNDTSPRSRSNILQALVQTGSDEALAPIVEACRSDDEDLQKQAVKLLSGWKNVNALPVMIELASDESMSMANHVTLMRGVSRILAGQGKWTFKKEPAIAALEACRRSEEKQIIQDILDKNSQ